MIYLDQVMADTSVLVDKYIEAGQHIGGRPITSAAFDALSQIRKQHNINLKAKIATKSRSKL